MEGNARERGEGVVTDIEVAERGSELKIATLCNPKTRVTFVSAVPPGQKII